MWLASKLSSYVVNSCLSLTINDSIQHQPLADYTLHMALLMVLLMVLPMVLLTTWLSFQEGDVFYTPLNKPVRKPSRGRRQSQPETWDSWDTTPRWSSLVFGLSLLVARGCSQSGSLLPRLADCVDMCSAPQTSAMASKLEGMDREQLLQQCQKQTVLLRKTKVKLDGTSCQETEETGAEEICQHAEHRVCCCA
jgi:hypothetical protein